MNKIKSFIDNKPIATFCIIMVVQICLIIFWGCMKSNFHQDELYSFESAHYINDQTPKNMYMHDTPMFSKNVWLNTGEFRKLLLVNDESTIFNDKPSSIADKFFKSEPYDILLNIFMYVFSYNSISKWPGILLNIIFYIISQLLIYKLVNRLSDNKKLALATIFLYGCSCISLSFAIYTRFYSYALMMISIAIYLHYKMWIEHKIVRCFIYEILGLLSFVQAFMCSEIVAIIAAGWFLCFSIALVINKKWFKLIVYEIPALLGAWYLFILCNVLHDVLLHPQKYMDGSGSPLDLMFTNFLSLGKRQFIKRTYTLVDYIGNSLFGNTIIFIVLLLILFVLFFRYVKSKKKNGEKIYIKNENNDFIVIMAGMVIIYSVFSILVGLWLPRYHALMYPTFFVIFMCIYQTLLKNSKRVYTYVVAVLLLLGIIFTNCFIKIDNVFLQDRATLQKINSFGNIDSVVWNMDDYQIIMECAYQMPEDSKMYVCSEYEPLYFEDFGDEYLLWTDDSEPLTEEALEDIGENGYEVVDYLGVAADANIYYCRKIEK